MKIHSIYFLFFVCVLCVLKTLPIKAQIPFCGYADSNDENIKGFRASNGWRDKLMIPARRGDGSGIVEIVDQIRKVIRTDDEIIIYRSKDHENNCFSFLSDDNFVLLVDMNFLDRVNHSCSSQWGAIQVVAHEVGHLISGFKHSPYDNEFNADYWSGVILQKLGAGEPASTKAILNFGSETNTKNHPNKQDRAEMIKLGWNDARDKRIKYEKCNGCSLN